MQLIRQPIESNLCLACCVAMVTDTTLERVLADCELSHRYPAKHEHLRHRGGYLPLIEAAKYLINHNMLFGTVFSWEKDPQKVAADGLQINCNVSNAHAIVTAQSLTLGPEYLHSVVWNSETKTVFDPQEPNQQSISRYGIVEWASITPIDEHN